MKRAAKFLFPVVVSVFLFSSCPGTESPGREEILLPPSKPQTPQLVFWNNSIVAGWSGVSGAGSYEIYCGTDSGNPGTAVKTTGATSAVLTVPGDSDAFIDGTTYYVWIQAKNSAGSSPLSDPADQNTSGEGPLYRDTATVEGKSVLGKASYAMTFTVPIFPPGYMDAGKEQTKNGVFVQDRNISIDTFKMAKYETTGELYFVVQAWALENGYCFANTVSVFSDDNKHKPVTGISWRDAVVWCNAYSEMTGRQPVYTHSGNVLRDSRDANAAACDGAVMDKTKNGYRLPTEAEREFAARGGDPGLADWMFMYAGSNTVDEVAWHHGNSPYTTREAGGKKPNRLGIFDLSGNAQEWCWDWMNYAMDVAAGTPEDGVSRNTMVDGRNAGNQKPFPGGGVGSNSAMASPVYRWGYTPDYTDLSVGFRVLCGAD